VNVQSPISQAGGKIVPLSKTTLETTALLSQRCAALAGGQYSSFVVSGRDALPIEPGGWLVSPLAFRGTESAGPRIHGVLPMSNAAFSAGVGVGNDVVSVRRIPSSTAVISLLSTIDWAAGCGS
jgi:hypothetical protein